MYTCVCDDGYTGDDCDTDINECDTDPCYNDGTCEVHSVWVGLITVCFITHVSLGYD